MNESLQNLGASLLRLHITYRCVWWERSLWQMGMAGVTLWMRASRGNSLASPLTMSSHGSPALKWERIRRSVVEPRHSFLVELVIVWTSLVAARMPKNWKWEIGYTCPIWAPIQLPRVPSLMGFPSRSYRKAIWNLMRRTYLGLTLWSIPLRICCPWTKPVSSGKN